MPAVVAGDADAGLVIHEGRFTYPDHGLHKVLDLGSWWEEATGLPVPLGVIAARRLLGEEFRAWMEERIRASLEEAERAPDELWPFIRDHAQEMDRATIREHIATFVTGFTRDMGDEGEEAIRRLVR
jgi:1,4-dihydroxy-6-naphthoate synthase